MIILDIIGFAVIAALFAFSVVPAVVGHLRN
jgi:hypothetical protein